MNDLKEEPLETEKNEQPHVTEANARPRRREERNRGGIVGPILLIAAGVFFLLSNMGLISWSFWDAIWRLWPIALIAVGLDLLIGRRSLLASLIVAIVTIGMLVAGFFWLDSGPAAGGEITDTIGESLSGAESAEVTLDFGVGRATLGALPAGSDSLVEGSIERPDDRGARVEQSYEVDGGVAIYELRTEGSFQIIPFFGPPDDNWFWDLQLNPDVPMDLTVNTGVGETTLDLRTLTLSDLHVDTGVGQTTVMLPGGGQLEASVNGGVGETTLDLRTLTLSDLHVDTGVGETTVILPGGGQLEASVNGGVGELIIEIPDGIPARIDVDTGLGATDVSGDFEQDGDVFTSPGYEDAPDRITLEIDAGVGQVTVRPYGGR